MKKILRSAFLWIPLAVSAQQDTASLNPVTVTASLQPLPASRTGRNIISLPGSYFTQLPVHSVDELLRFIPGVEVQQRGPAGSQSDIVIRGGTFQQVLVVLDGLRLNDPNTGHFSSYIPIAPSEIERVEILKGASSALYGSEAVGGVIQIITKTFAAKAMPAKQSASVQLSAGQYDFIHLNAGLNMQQKQDAFSAGWLTSSSKGQWQRGTRGFFHNHTGSASWKHRFDPHWTLALRSAWDQRDFGAQNFYTSFVSDTASEKVTSSWNQLALQFQKGKHQLNLDAGYKAVKDQYQYNPVSTANKNKSGLTQGMLTDHYQISPHSVLSTGMQWQNKTIRSNDRGNHERMQGALFAVWRQQWNHWTVTPSLRADWNETRGTELIPQLNISWQKGFWQLRGSAGKTIRDADFTEQFNNYNKSFVGGGSIGNPDLEAERSFSYEAGLDYTLSGEFKIAFTAFERNQTRLIDWITTPYALMPRKVNLSPTGTYALASNIASVHTGGIEADLQWQKTWKRDYSLFATTGFLWLQSKTREGNASFYLSSHARFLANTNIICNLKKISITANALFKNRKPQSASAIHASVSENIFLLNFRASVQAAQKISLFAEADNVFDTRASDLLGSVLPGRWISAGIRLIR